MCDNKTDSYARRFKRVFDYIDRHLDDALLLENSVKWLTSRHFISIVSFAAIAGCPLVVTSR